MRDRRPQDRRSREAQADGADLENGSEEHAQNQGGNHQLRESVAGFASGNFEAHSMEIIALFVP